MANELKVIGGKKKEIYTGEVTMNVYAQLIIWRSEDEETWEPVKPYNVPEWVRAPEIIKQLAQGIAVKQSDEAKYWYGATHKDDSHKLEMVH